MINNGKEYEVFVASIQKALFDSEQWPELKNIEIERNKKILDRCGVEREFDLYWEYELAGVTYKTVIECKDYASTISIDKIDALIGKTQDIPDLKALFTTKKGYQSGAQIKAQQHCIDLLIVRESNDNDWTLADGTPCIREVCISVIAILPARIKSFTPQIDVEWVKANIEGAKEGKKN